MENFLDPAILFFVFGVFAGLIKSNLSIPEPLTKFLSLYLLMGLGLKGGFALNESGFNTEIIITLLIAIFLAILVPILGYNFLKHRLGRYDAAAISATYGSVSAVTFITASQFLDNNSIPYGGHMAAAMALMESPAIIIAIYFGNRASMYDKKEKNKVPTVVLIKDSLKDGAQLLLIGAMVVGFFSGKTGEQTMAPFSIDLFKGMLAFFLLDMGLQVAKNLGTILNKSKFLILYSLLGPPIHAIFALILARIFEVPLGDTVLLMILAASASYIAVPAALKYAIPKADPTLYFGMSLGITFPINILIGIPFYTWLAQSL
ncbi:sodium-dependent bicarbonate transport family permease [Candidatus Pelagibacter bacterium]|jgi:hypothetical protein|nr:sodium-dependent bicarbonate transport family permease [Candidatus Pelagibacter bacterium]MDB3932371.1 sodium-dependent bicarbonate transport family permease [Candidatus Pelagibacter sp.]